MLKKNKLLILILILGIFLPLLSASAGVVPCGLSEDDPNLEGDQTAVCTLCHLILGFRNVIDFGLKILITIAAVGIFIAGVLYIISAGNEEMMKRAKAFLSASLTGFTITLMAWFIVNSIMWIISNNSNLGLKHAQGFTNWYTFTCNTQSSATQVK